MGIEDPTRFLWRYDQSLNARFEPQEKREILELLNYFNVELGLSVSMSGFIRRAVQLYMYNLSHTNKEILKKEVEALHDKKCGVAKVYKLKRKRNRSSVPSVKRDGKNSPE